MLIRYMSPTQSPSVLTRAIELDRPTIIDGDGSRWCDADATPHVGSGKPAVMGIPVADYCPRLAGSIAKI